MCVKPNKCCRLIDFLVEKVLMECKARGLGLCTN
jgi:hypothetical protein